VAWAGEVQHGGQRIRDALLARRAIRRGRRQRHTRDRPQRVDNRHRPAGWLPPSLESHLSNVLTWVVRVRRLAPVTTVAQELVQFDTQLMAHPEIMGIEYQQGDLAGYEIREYLLETFGRTCASCSAMGVPLQIEHSVAKARGGSDRVSCLTIACAPCNAAKGTRTAEEFGHPEVQAQAWRSLMDAAAVNATRWALYQRLQATGLPVEVGTDGRTKWNRTQRGLPMAHWIDAACVGASTPPVVRVADVVPLGITATGHGTRQRCGTDHTGFPMRHRRRQPRHFGVTTGDLVQAVVPPGRKTAGRHLGRVLVRASGSCDLATAAGRVPTISSRYCRIVARRDAYA
jgi:5-methylcytosine-specific restriction endonuclease McrA